MINTTKFESLKNEIHTLKEFLSLCTQKEKQIITGIYTDITFATFMRLTYLTDFFACHNYNTHLWNSYGSLFKQKIDNEMNEETNKSKIMQYLTLHEQWVTEFINRKARII